jgi:hypothetical protein
MNKAQPSSYRVGDEIGYAMPAGMLYGTVTRVLGAGDSAAVEIEFEDGRKEIKKTRDRALSLLRRVTGQSEEEERHRDREKLKDLDIERVRRSEQRKH